MPKIVNRVIQDGDYVFGVYDSPTTYIMIHYVNKGANPTTNTSGAHIDVEQMFDNMEILERRKFARKQ